MRPIKISIFVFAVLVLGALAIALPRSRAQGLQGFGGAINRVQYCTCSGGIFLELGPPSSGSVVFQLGISQLFSFGQIFYAGPQTIGTYTPGGVCEYDPPYCENSETPTLGTVVTIGTSL